jgi:hypothetical protein
MKSNQAAIVERASRMHQLYKLLKDAEEDEPAHERARTSSERRA